MEVLIRLQEDIHKKINRAFINYKKSPRERLTEGYIETRMETLDKQWSIFDDNHQKLICEFSKEDFEVSEYHRKDLYEKTEDIYTDYKAELKECHSKLKTKHSEKLLQLDSHNERDQISVKLPRIAIPSFSGKYSEWITFRDLFLSLIHHNNSLQNVQRLHYLKSYLTGEAEQLLRHLPITSDNYSTCWNLLEHRFNNKRYITSSILKRFFSQRNIVTESCNSIKELYDTTNECLNALTSVGIKIDNWDVIIIYILCLKLDNESRKQWESKICSLKDELPNLNLFLEFLENRFRSLEFLPTNFVKNNRLHHVTNTDGKSVQCSYCSELTHKVGNCKQFANENLTARRNFVQNSNLCYNCLGANHSVTSCRLPTRCRICKKKHHSLLHSNSFYDSTDTKVDKQSVDNTNVVVTSTTASLNEIGIKNINTCFSNTKSQVILATALVKAATNSGSNMTLRSLLDQGSQASFITESAVQLLGLRKIHCNSVISGVGGEGNTSLKSKHIVYIQLQSIHDPKFTINIKAHVLNKLTSFLPERKCVVRLWPDLPRLKLADSDYNIPNKIDMLLGADVYCEILTEGLVRSPTGTLIAQNTKLGWIISGKVSDNISTNHISCKNVIVTSCTQFDNDEFNLKKFWELESEGFFPEKKQFTLEEQRYENIYKTTTKRDESGRYIVKLPFREVDPSCKYGNSLEIAMNRFFMLEKRFTKSPTLKSQYAEVISEYLKLDHMEVVPKDEIDKIGTVYLPHHAVIRNDKTTTKCRVVFDASCRDNKGVSLNSELMVGPRLQLDLRHIIMKWRLHPICLVADIVKMYRQVKVTNDDTDCQRLVWRNDSSEDIDYLRITRVAFGTASAPYLAVRTLHQVAYDEGKQLPLASKKILEDFYMDDLLTGCKSVSEGKQLFMDIVMILSKGGFELQKWSSNNEELLNEISKANIETTNKLELKTDEIIKILGLTWNRRTDDFEYSVQLPPISEPVTKRKVISDIAKLFDPMGWLAPAIIRAKIIIQRLWLAGIAWDEELPPKLLNDWITYRNELKELTNFRLPRWIKYYDAETSTLELHGFSDASGDAYAAVIYVRILDKAGEIHVYLITAKTKVAPVKQVSIPRLELCGAVMLAKLLQEVSVLLNIPKSNIHAWTDSTVVLAWLSSHPSRWKTFIANRVSEILNILDRNQWSHVSTKDNPADHASRGITPTECVQLKSWKTGPSWLKRKTINYSSVNILDTNMEEKKVVYHIIEEDSLSLWTKFSSLHKLIRVLAFCRRFITKLKQPNLIISSWLSSKELNEALIACIKRCQSMNFMQEIKDIKKHAFVNKKSKLMSLNPFLDDCNVLRVGGRLEKADLSKDIKHPMILPSKSHLTELIVADAHRQTLHGGPQLMINYLGSKYWIINVKNEVKKFVHKCVVCLRYVAPSKNQFMGQLPPSRVTPIRAFYQSGVDYAGPIQIRASKGRGHCAYKGYICLFVCMATRAIHLEVVSDLTTHGFLAAFRRFVARRGHCADLYSDNGTNFVGASRELKTLLFNEKSSLVREIGESLAINGTTWHFIPPHAPNFGGLWEAGVKSTKYHLKRVIGNNTLTFEEMSTLIYQIEACLNSRPISQISVDSQDPTPLTPGHFLIGEPLMLVPDSNYETSSISSLKRWQLTQKILQQFWRRWSREYLTKFFHRYKWANKIPEPNIGDIVLVKDDDLPPARWLLGIIVKKYPGLDNITRVVSIKCQNSIIKRPVTKLCVLPIAN